MFEMNSRALGLFALPDLPTLRAQPALPASPTLPVVPRVRAARGAAVSLCMALCMGLCAVATPVSTFAQGQPSEPTTTNFKRFLSWFGGEWNNYEQVWQQRGDAKGAKLDDPIAHTHHIFAPVAVPKLGEHIFYVQQSLDADMSKAYRQRLYRLTPDAATQSIKLEIFSLPNEKDFFNAHLRPETLLALEPASLKPSPGCEVYWRFQAEAQAYEGTMVPKACSFMSTRLGKKIILSDTLKLTDSEIWINDQARDEQGGHVFGSKTDTPIKNRKVRYYTGWVFGADASGKKLKGRRDLLIHNEGHIVPLLWEDGSASPYAVQLAQLTYQNTKTPILKLALNNTETQKTEAYSWASTDANRIGLNLGWIQFGFTQKATNIAFGFGKE